MYQLTIRLSALAGKTHELLQALRSVMLPAEFEEGFLGGQLYADSDNSSSFCFVEEWDTRADLEREIRSPRFGRLLAVMETTAGFPIVEVRLITETLGWNYIRVLRGNYAAEGGNGVNN